VLPLHSSRIPTSWLNQVEEQGSIHFHIPRPRRATNQNRDMISMLPITILSYYFATRASQTRKETMEELLHLLAMGPSIRDSTRHCIKFLGVTDAASTTKPRVQVSVEISQTEKSNNIVLYHDLPRPDQTHIHTQIDQGPKRYNTRLRKLYVCPKQPTSSSWRRRSQVTAWRPHHRQCSRDRTGWPLHRRWSCCWWASGGGVWAVPGLQKAGHIRQRPNRSCCPCISYDSVS
jgi:hypothetical protein